MDNYPHGHPLHKHPHPQPVESAIGTPKRKYSLLLIIEVLLILAAVLFFFRGSAR